MIRPLLLSLVFALSFFASASAQSEGGAAESSDPKAKAILDKLKAKYDKFLALEVDVTLTLDVPEREAEVIKGKMVQSGDKFRTEMGDHIVISNGKSIWTVMKEQGVVQLSDAEQLSKDDAFLTPKDLVNMYEDGAFIYALEDEVKENGKTLQKIIFKPVDEDAEFFKIRLTVDKEAQTISSVKVFSRDGTRYTLDIDSIRPNKIYKAAYFEYDDSLCEECEVEDLRY